MSWSPGRRRNVQKLLTFTPEEWEQVDANWTACATDPRYERFADFARAALTRTQIRVIEVPTSPVAWNSPDASRANYLTWLAAESSIVQVRHCGTVDTRTPEKRPAFSFLPGCPRAP